MADKVKKKADNPGKKTDSEQKTKQEVKEKKPDKSDDFEEKPLDDRQMFKTTCSECGKETEVPFEPEEGRDVYCKECYQKRRPARRSFGGRDGGGGRDRYGGRPREMHKVICSECGKDAEVPFKPDGRKPVLCKECFIKKKESGITAS